MNNAIDKKNSKVELTDSNPIQEANAEAVEQNLPFAACRKCGDFRKCPIPSMSNTNMMVPEPHKCWLESMKNDPNGRSVLVRMLANAQNRYGLLMIEMDSLEATINLLTEAIDSAGRVSLHNAGALNRVKASKVAVRNILKGR